VEESTCPDHVCLEYLRVNCRSIRCH
jgi:hypothetical protein